MKLYRWKLGATPTAEQSTEQNLPFSGLAGKLLVARGKNTPEAVAAFVAEQPCFADPFELKDMDVAVERISQAIQNGERMVVYGDYDCDGITSTALLYSYLEAIGADVIYYIPDREVEGYGLNNEAIKFLRDMREVDLIITVDNGISAHEQVDYANSLGMQVVITDHHTPHGTLPNAVAVVDPHRADDESPFKNLAGVGVAFKLAAALEGESGDELMEHYGELVAIGTVADVVELAGENRQFVKAGIKALRSTERPGIRALAEQAGINLARCESEQIAFGLAPRINAAGRMGDVYHALELFLTDDEEQAAALADTLCEYNDLRKTTEADIVKTIRHTLETTPGLLTERVILVSGEGWHPGVIGIIASKLVETYGKPCFIVSFKDGVGRASGRSIPDVSLIAGLRAAGEHLEQFGGHVAAAGFTVLAEKYEEFKACFLQHYCDEYGRMPANTLVADLVATPEELCIEEVEAVNRVLAPFGEGNPQPLYALLGFTIELVTPLSQGKHMRLTVGKKGKTFTVLWFGMPEDRFPFVVGDKVDLLADLSINEFKGQKQLSIKLADIHLTGFKQNNFFEALHHLDTFYRGEDFADIEAVLLPTREEIGEVYKFLRKLGPQKRELLRLYEKFGQTLPFEKFYMAVECLAEFDFIGTEGISVNKTVVLHHNNQKADLLTSATLRAVSEYTNKRG